MIKMAYYPGCSLSATGIEYNLSTKAVAKSVGLELWEIPDWNCCGASSAHGVNHLLALALPARNLAIAEEAGLDVAVPCAACYSRLKATEIAAKESEETRSKISEIIERDYRAASTVRSLLDVMVNQVGVDNIKILMQKPLKNLKIAAYYGCLLVRPVKAGFDDPEDPKSMDLLMDTLGATPIDWPFKTECCGAGHATIRPEIGLKMVKRLLDMAKDSGAEAMVTACPMCLVNLDMRQAEIEKKFQVSYKMPVFYFTELMGLALGHTARELGLGRHFVDPMPLLAKKELINDAARRD